MIRLFKVAKVRDRVQVPDGFVLVNAVSWFPDNVLEIGDSKIPLYQVSPYYLKDERGSHML